MTPTNPPADTGWFTHDRFGMFIHWGPGALHPGEVSWARYRDPILDGDYQKYIDHFEPDLYDPDRWIAAAKRAGMKYAVLTTKHHDGFCLWDTKLSEYKATNTPAGRDLVGPFVEACRRHGLKVGFYYSLFDWNHPQFPLDFLHPMRNDPAFRAQTRDMALYREYMFGHLRELLTWFGKIDIMWFDFSYADPEKPKVAGWPADHWVGKGRDDWDSPALCALVRELSPGILINDRADYDADFRTCEQYQPPAKGQEAMPWEACLTLTDTWIYNREDRNWKSPEMILRTLVDSVASGGNVLLNIGPNGRGRMDAGTIRILDGVADWMDVHARAIQGCGPSAFKAPDGCRFTQNGNRLYVHVQNWPRKYLRLEGLGQRVQYAQLLNDASEIRRAKRFHMMQEDHLWGPDTLMLEVPIQPPGPLPVIELFLDRPTP